MSKWIIDSKIHKHDKVYGAATVGARGQVVIPAAARKDLKIRPGDQLLVLGKFGKALGLVKAEEFEKLVELIMRHIPGRNLQAEFKKHIETVLGRKN